MKKFMKKAISAIAVAAMAFTMVIVPSVKAKAADWNDGSVWIVGGNAALSGSGTSTWDPADAKAMTYNAVNGTYSVTFTATAGTTYEFKFLPDLGSWSDAWGPSSGNYALMALSDGEATITFNPASTEAVPYTATGLVDTNPAEEYYVVGGINGWSFTANKMTAVGDGTYTATFEDVDASFEFKIAQDAPTYGWYKQWGGYAAGQSADNATATVTELSDVTITFDPTAGSIAIKVVKVPEEPETTTVANENETTTVAPTKENETTTTASTTENQTTTANNGGNGNGGSGNGEGNVPAGIVTPIVVISLVAIAAFAGAVICAKKKVTE